MYLISNKIKILSRLLKSISLKIKVKRAIVNENLKKKKHYLILILFKV